MKNLIAAAKKSKEIQELLAGKVDKAEMTEIAKMASVTDIANKYGETISNNDIEVAGDLKLTGIKKYWRCVS